ncbi:STAS domain-containing protein [Streptomyces sp. NPDC046977]|uniref:STAS domain-containing protein n=1 Tax=Streptomyces sp. NPDC046977 TaxID=3154703 RepID=UPI0033E018A0
MTTALTVEPERHADRLTLSLTGEMDIDSCSRVSDALDLDGCTSVVLDLAGLTFMDSSGVNLVLRLRQRLAPEGVHLALHGVQGQPRRLVTLVGLETVVEVEPAARTAQAWAP